MISRDVIHCTALRTDVIVLFSSGPSASAWRGGKEADVLIRSPAKPTRAYTEQRAPTPPQDTSKQSSYVDSMISAYTLCWTGKLRRCLHQIKDLSWACVAME